MKTSPYRTHRGRWRVRVRDEYVRDFVRPMIEQNAVGVVKLDLVLRGLASLGPDEPGRLPAELRWEDLHDLCRDRNLYLEGDRKVKRAWLSDKLGRLERLSLIARGRMPGRRSEIVVLRDTRTSQPFDDPGAVGEHYVTFLGGLVEFGHLGMWSAADLAAFFCAMHAERYDRASPELSEAVDNGLAPVDGGRWFRPLHWFGQLPDGVDPTDSRIRYGFSERTLQRGFTSLESRGLVLKERIIRDPRNGKYFERPRTLYHNGFDELLHTANYRKARLGERASHARDLRERRFAAAPNLVEATLASPP